MEMPLAGPCVRLAYRVLKRPGCERKPGQHCELWVQRALGGGLPHCRVLVILGGRLSSVATRAAWAWGLADSSCLAVCGSGLRTPPHPILSPFGPLGALSGVTHVDSRCPAKPERVERVWEARC